MFRQGDVLIVPVEKLPSKAKAVARDQGRVVLAYGEVTGHAHAIKADWVTQLEDDANRRWLEVKDKSADLSHEEHGTITVPPGTYRVVQQREYEGPDSFRNVAD